ncbi:MAG: hypothetical protein U0350_01425 [Caldilineaceae bacterium]
MTQQAIMKGDVQQKLSSTGFISGAILVGMSGLLMPRAANPTSDLQAMLQPLGEAQLRTTIAALLGMIGFWATFSSMVGINRAITARGAAWARLGFHFAGIGIALWTVCWALDVATASAVANWLAAPTASKEAAWSVVAGLSVFGHGLIPMTWIIYWLALALLNIAMLQSGHYPRWLAWVGLSVSMAVIALGVIQVFTPRSLTLTLIFSVLMLLTTLWNLATGIWIARKAG